MLTMLAGGDPGLTTSHPKTMRPRREVSAVTLRWLQPLFRYSYTRDAWVLRVVGNRLGPVLVVRQAVRSTVKDAPEQSGNC
jgi:hypothetical protein